MIDLTHATPELFATFIEAQAEIENATKNQSNPFHKSKYADLNEVISVIKPVFTKHKLGFQQFPSFDGALASVTTVISNDKGAYITGVASCVPAKSDAQSVGSCTTYLRRYSLAGIVGIYQEDDDGNSQQHDKKPQARQTKQRESAKTQAPAPVNPHTDKIKTFRDVLIEEATGYGLIERDSNGHDWFNALAKAAVAKAGKNTIEMTDKELDSFLQTITDAATDQMNIKQGEAANA